MIEIHGAWLLWACVVLAVALIGSLFWRSKQPITPTTVLAAAKEFGSLFTRLYSDATIIVQWLEQISAPDVPGAPPKLTNSEKKERAVTVLKRRWKDADPEDIEIAIEAAVNGVKTLKRMGITLPQVQLSGTDEIDDLLRDVGLTPPPSGVGMS